MLDVLFLYPKGGSSWIKYPKKGYLDYPFCFNGIWQELWYKTFDRIDNKILDQYPVEVSASLINTLEYIESIKILLDNVIPAVIDDHRKKVSFKNEFDLIKAKLVL